MPKKYLFSINIGVKNPGNFQLFTDLYYFFIHFQVIIEGVWGNNRASGFIAVDDVTFYEGKKPLLIL